MLFLLLFADLLGERVNLRLYTYRIAGSIRLFRLQFGALPIQFQPLRRRLFGACACACARRIERCVVVFLRLRRRFRRARLFRRQFLALFLRKALLLLEVLQLRLAPGLLDIELLFGRRRLCLRRRPFFFERSHLGVGLDLRQFQRQLGVVHGDFLALNFL